MSESEESWESVSADEIKLTKTDKKTRISHQTTKIKILHQILYIIESLKYKREYFISNGLNVYEKLNQIQNKSPLLQKDVFKGMFQQRESTLDSPMFDVFENETVSLFISLNMNEIPCRIYFVLEKEISCFVEYAINGNIIKNTSTVKGMCFSVDFNGYIADQSITFSKTCPHHYFFTKIIGSIRRSLHLDSSVELFASLDSQRQKSIPQNISKIKIHPLYITEDCCRFNETIYPKRPVFGYFRGKAVYSRNNLVKLRTENGWYNQGKVLKNKDQCIPYRIYKGKKLFAEFQTEDLEINDINSSIMDAFHPNHIPKNCIYINYDPQIAKILGLRHAECVIGFRGNERIFKGFYVEKRHCYIVNHFIKEKEYYEKIFDQVERYRDSIKEWKKFMKKASKMIEIQKRIGM